MKIEPILTIEKLLEIVKKKRKNINLEVLLGCRKLSYYQEEVPEVNWKIFRRGLEKNEIAEKKRSSSSTYGFNGQEKDDEVAGEGNSYTAMYWQYDSRIGRR